MNIQHKAFINVCKYIFTHVHKCKEKWIFINVLKVIDVIILIAKCNIQLLYELHLITIYTINVTGYWGNQTPDQSSKYIPYFQKYFCLFKNNNDKNKVIRWVLVS